MAAYGGRFESASLVAEKKEERRAARRETLQKAIDDYEKEERRREAKKQRGDDRWLLPDVEQRLEEIQTDTSAFPRKKKKHKRKKEDGEEKKGVDGLKDDNNEDTSAFPRKKKKHKRRKEDEEKKGVDGLEDDNNEILPPCSAQRDEWMTFDFLAATATTTTAERRSERERAKAAEKEKAVAVEQANLRRLELNPFWKDGGDGLPPEDNVGTAASAVNDGGVAWLRRSLKRMKEEAERRQTSLDDVVAQRYGSMEKFQKRLADAERAAAALRKDWRRSDGGEEEERKKREREEWRRRRRASPTGGGEEERHRDRGREREEEERRIWNREAGRDGWRDKDRHGGREREERPPATGRSLKGRFLKPGDDDEPGPSLGPGRRPPAGTTVAFRKPPSDDNDDDDNDDDEQDALREARDPGGAGRRSAEEVAPGTTTVTSSLLGSEEEEEKKEEKTPLLPLLTDEEMNRLGAKLVKAEILGNEALVKQLKAQLDSARAAKEKMKTERPTEQVSEDQDVLLFRTDQSGRAWPISAPSAPQGGRRDRRKEKPIETHVGGERVRYFGDDDGSSLQELVRREKMGVARDQNARDYARLAAKMMGRGHDDSCTLDDMFESSGATRPDPRGREEGRAHDRALRESRALASALDACRRCFASPRLQKHLLVAVGSKAYLSLPAGVSLTEGHCLICPLQHHPAATQLDEDVWAEIQELRSALVRMFSSSGEECVFLETFMGPRRGRHMAIECIPLPRELGDLAPMYFKKAIMESDEEWSMNKKLINLSSKDIRRSVPRGLPYFAVDFGSGGGFAHVVENEDKFPHYFGKEVVGGMLDLEPRLWRRESGESFETQRQKVLRFAARWRPFDCTRGPAQPSP